MNKSLSSSIIAVFFIFLSWSLINYLGDEAYRMPENKLLIIPFLWSCIFIYLYGKNHFYIAINSYVIFLLILLADRLNFGDMPESVQISYLLLSFFMVFLFVFIYQVLFEKKKRLATLFSFFITITLYLVPLFYIIYSINFNTVITRDVFYAISQTSISESLEFISVYISPTWIGATFFWLYLLVSYC